MNANITMERLRLRLPAGWHGRETRLVRLIGSELGQLPFKDSVVCSVLTLPPLVARNGESDLSLARRIAQEIHLKLGQGSAPDVAGGTASGHERRSNA